MCHEFDGHRFGRTPASAVKPHGLELSEKTYAARTDAMHMQILKDTQGLHAPLRLLMEREAASKVGRLPFLTSSNLMTDILTGRDEDIGPEHLLNTPDDSEVAGTPLMVMQKSLNLM